MGRTLPGLRLTLDDKGITDLKQTVRKRNECIIRKYLRIRRDYLCVINEIKSSYHRSCRQITIRYYQIVEKYYQIVELFIRFIPDQGIA